MTLCHYKVTIVVKSRGDAWLISSGISSLFRNRPTPRPDSAYLATYFREKRRDIRLAALEEIPDRTSQRTREDGVDLGLRPLLARPLVKGLRGRDALR